MTDAISFGFAASDEAASEGAMPFVQGEETSMLLGALARRPLEEPHETRPLRILTFLGGLNLGGDVTPKLQMQFPPPPPKSILKRFFGPKSIGPGYREVAFLDPNPVRIRNLRKLQKEVPNLIAADADVWMLGPSLTDWIIATDYGQPVTSVDEFVNRLENLAHFVGLVLGIQLVLVVPTEPCPGTALENYLPALRSLASRAPSLVCVHASKDGIVHMGALLERLKAAEEQIATQRRAFREILPSLLPRLPVSAQTLEAGKMTRAELVTALWLSSNFAAVEGETGGIDEGLAVVGKEAGKIGGRSLLERWMQLRILSDLADQSQPGRPLVAVVGDSIRMRISDATGYGLPAYRRLSRNANILHVPHNCGNSRVSRLNFENWLSAGPDLICVNHGLHDCAVVPETFEPFVSHISLDEYRDTLEWIAETARARGKTLLWALATPVDEALHAWNPNRGTLRRLTRRNVDIEAYNAVAVEVMAKAGFDIVDLYTPLCERGVRSVVLPDGVHLNDAGARLAGEIVATAILSKLGVR
jgi:hypothetical protein